jgi:hypothetical protein
MPMPIIPNTRPEQTVRSDGVLTTVHKRAGAKPTKVRDLPSVPVSKTYVRSLIDRASDDGVEDVSEGYKPRGYDIVAAKVNGVETWYLLDKEIGGEVIVGRLEITSRGESAYLGDDIGEGEQIRFRPGTSYDAMFAGLAKEHKAAKKDDVVKKSTVAIREIKSADMPMNGTRMSFRGRYADVYIEKAKAGSRNVYIAGMHGAYELQNAYLPITEAKEELIRLLNVDTNPGAIDRTASN